MKLVANLVLCAFAFAAVTDASSFRRAEACDGGDPEPTPPPVTTVPATTVPATTVPATTVPATTVPATTVPATTVPATTVPATTVPATTVPATTVPATTVPATTVPATTVPATTVPATTVPATTVPATTVPATTAPATTAPATTAPPTSAPTPAWDLNTAYVKSGFDCDGFLRHELKAEDPLDEADCVRNFSFFNGATVKACVKCEGTYDNSLTLAPFPLCNNKPICGKIADLEDLTQAELECLYNAGGVESEQNKCKLGSGAVTPAPPATSAPTPAPETSAPPTTAPTPTYPVTYAPVPTAPSTYNMDTVYVSSGRDCLGFAFVEWKDTDDVSTMACAKNFLFNTGTNSTPACLVCEEGVYDESVSPPLCAGKPICGTVGVPDGKLYWDLTQRELKCIVDANGDQDIVDKTCDVADNLF